ncbi:hypothetical protein T07_14649 [Trichinella nelsoni]|uniref:Uncharacterized protein n=1 Tax=Trichinella nelsoni TaxID=6336 RepID=A0A0V0RR30_9BILA|nr:hypothetical protein T07_14649 [Trichinella nelsoni]
MALGKYSRMAELADQNIEERKVTACDKDQVADENSRSHLTAFVRFIWDHTDKLTESCRLVRKGNTGKSKTTTNRKDDLIRRRKRMATFLHASVANGCPFAWNSRKASDCTDLLHT